MDLGLAGKNVLLFGGNATIGYATSLSFAKEGANIALACRDVDAGRRVAEKAKELGSKKAIVVRADATKWNDVKAAVSKDAGRARLDRHLLSRGRMGLVCKLL